MNNIIIPPRLEHESIENYNYFVEFVKLGTSRTIEKLVEFSDKSASQLIDLSNRFRWAIRVKKVKYYNTYNSINYKENKMENLELIRIKENMNKNNQIDIIKKMTETLNNYLRIINQCDDNYISQEDSYEVKLAKVEKVYRVFNLYITINARLNKEFARITKTEKEQK